jgi:hypothetical protein
MSNHIFMAVQSDQALLENHVCFSDPNPKCCADVSDVGSDYTPTDSSVSSPSTMALCLPLCHSTYGCEFS